MLPVIVKSLVLVASSHDYYSEALQEQHSNSQSSDEEWLGTYVVVCPEATFTFVLYTVEPEAPEPP